MDKKAKTILLKTYWDSNGWKFNCLSLKEMIKQGYISSEDFEYAKSKNLMFEPLSLTHDQCIDLLLKAAACTNKQALASAFLSSLSTRKLYLRSAIASYCNAQKTESHLFQPDNDSCDRFSTKYKCDICKKKDLYGIKEYAEEDLNVLNFERVKWGGIRHEHILYCMFDLEQFIKLDKLIPNDKDIGLFKDILCTIEKCEDTDAPRQLEKKLNGVFPSSKQEREVLIKILAQLDILKPAKERPIRGSKNDWSKVEHWRGEDGYNKQAVQNYFGDYLDD